MAKKKSITENDLISWFMDHVLEHDKKPSSIYIFAKSHNFEESQFYTYFGSFEALEKHIFEVFYNSTISLLEKNESYMSFDARNKLLSFYFTFFEILTANRSYVVHALSGQQSNLKKLQVLSKLRLRFSNYIDTLNIETLETKQKSLDKLQQKAIQESAWFQLLMTVKFWLDDTSANFEKTDIFIEKSVNASFDIMNIAPIKSVIDFGKFLFKEKMHMN